MLQTPCICAPCARRALRCGCGGRKLSACSLNIDLIAWGRFEGVCTASSELLGSRNKLCLAWAPLVGQEPCLFVQYSGYKTWSITTEVCVNPAGEPGYVCWRNLDGKCCV